MSGYIDKEGLLEDLSLLLEETQTKTGCSFSDDIPYGEVLACIEGNAISVEYTEQDVRDAFNDGYSCGKEESADAVPLIHGHWIRGRAYPHHIYCSNCFRTYVPNDESEMWKDQTRLPRKYCPECGALMDEVTE